MESASPGSGLDSSDRTNAFRIIQQKLANSHWDACVLMPGAAASQQAAPVVEIDRGFAMEYRYKASTNCSTNTNCENLAYRYFWSGECSARGARAVQTLKKQYGSGRQAGPGWRVTCSPALRNGFDHPCRAAHRGEQLRNGVLYFFNISFTMRLASAIRIVDGRRRAPTRTSETAVYRYVLRQLPDRPKVQSLQLTIGSVSKRWQELGSTA